MSICRTGNLLNHTIAEFRSLQGPVYDADRDHHFKALVVHAHELKNLQGPVYDTGADRAHQFQQGPDSTGHNNSMNAAVSRWLGREEMLTQMDQNQPLNLQLGHCHFAWVVRTSNHVSHLQRVKSFLNISAADASAKKSSPSAHVTCHAA